jgi:hypothetical protein
MDTETSEIEKHEEYMSCNDSEIAFSFQALKLVEFDYPLFFPDILDVVYQAFRKKVMSHQGMKVNQFTYLINESRNTIGTLLPDRGWKFHISLNNTGDNIARGWNIAKKYLIQNKLFQFKVIRDESRSAVVEPEIQAGKAITIYAFFEKLNANEWQIILEQITVDYLNNNILPSLLPIDDIPVKNSSYMSYRNDKMSYVYSLSTDPFKDIQINVPGQPKKTLGNVGDEKGESSGDEDLGAVSIDVDSLDDFMMSPPTAIEPTAQPQSNITTIDQYLNLDHSLANEVKEEKNESIETVSIAGRNSFWSNSQEPVRTASNDLCCFKGCVIL